jgi:hypothetical protein
MADGFEQKMARALRRRGRTFDGEGDEQGWNAEECVASEWTPMTAPLKKPVSRVIGESIVVTLTREGLYIREHGRRRTYGPLPYGVLLLQAARDYADGVRAARRKPRLVGRGKLAIGGIR